MAFTIMTHMAKSGPEMFYNPKFRLMIETHMNILRNDRPIVTMIPENLYYQYEGDFYGYLVGENIQPHLHWIYMRVNNMFSPDEFAKDLRDPYQPRSQPLFIKPLDANLDDIQRMYLSLKNK